MHRLLDTMTERLGLPEELQSGTARLTLTAGKRVWIEDYQCLLSFTSEALEVGCGTQRLRVRGEGLRICCMDRRELMASGTILAVEVDGA